MGRIISTSSTNTRHKTSRRSEEREANTHTHTKHKYTMKITGLIASTMLLLMASAPSGLLASPENDEIYKEQVLEELLRYQVEGPFLRQDVPAPRGRKLALIPLADLADIGLGVQKIFNPTNGQVNSNDVRGLANTLQKYLPFPFLATGRQGSRGGGSSRKPTGGKPTGGKPTGGKPTGRTPTQGGGGEGEEGR